LLVWQGIDGDERAKDALQTPISASCLARNLMQREGMRFLQTNKRYITNKQFQLLVWQGIEGALRRQ
jgi:hypothetical protein